MSVESFKGTTERQGMLTIDVAAAVDAIDATRTTRLMLASML